MTARSTLLVLLITALAPWAQAHDTWVQTNSNVVRTGDAVHVDLMLGNHGNDHRDFKLASKIDLAVCTLDILSPDGNTYDLKPDVIDMGYAPKEGYWSAKFVAAQPGLYLVDHTVDTLHRTTRAIKSAKTFFVVSPTLDKVDPHYSGYDRLLGHPLELVPEMHPVTPMGPGVPFRLRLYFKGQPLAGARVTFIPRGQALSESFDDRFERMTDEEGRASFTPTTGNYYLAVVHHAAPEETGEGYDRTHYTAALTMLVPEICPCCEE